MGTAIGVALTAALLVGVAAGPASAAPRGPTDTQVAQAQAAAETVVDRIRALSAELAAARAAVANAQAASAIALDEYQATQADLEAAQAAAEQAAAAAAQAATDLQASHDALVAFARRSFMSHSTYTGTHALITAASPAELVERAALLNATGAHRTDEVGRFAEASTEADRAEAAAQGSLAQAGVLQQQAAGALAAAQTAERAARQQAADVATEQAGLQEQLDTARARLVELVGEREAADRLARHQVATPSSSGGIPVDRTEAGPGSASAARAPIDAALTYLGTPYSWGGGGAHGPGYGIDLDVRVFGFDCSGLTQYAYHRAGITIPRNSRAQYAHLPKVARADLQAGDLVFWANDPGNPSTIRHVAIWLGDGTVLQAPQSGDVVKISRMWWGGYAGAVRPSA